MRDAGASDGKAARGWRVVTLYVDLDGIVESEAAARVALVDVDPRAVTFSQPQPVR